jgi:hypothetical protein
VHPLINAFWQIVLFRQGPDSLPYSRPLLMFAGAAYACVSLLLSLLAEQSRLEPAEYGPGFILGSVVVTDLMFEIVFLAALLLYFNCMARFRQALCAVFGTGAIQGALLLPCVGGLLLANVMVEQSFLEVIALVMSLLGVVGLIGIVLWSVSVYAHILSTTLSRSFGIGMALAALSFYLNYQLIELLPGF